MHGALTTAILVCALAATALGAPTYKRPAKLDPKVSEHVRAAEQAWDAAEREADPAKQVGEWERAAEAFAVIDGDPVDVKVKRDAAYAAILAWKNALAVDPRAKVPASSKVDRSPQPRPLPDRELKLLATIDRYVGYVDPKDPELPGLLYVKAATHLRFDQLEVAIPMLRDVVDRFPDSEVAGYAAQLVLDSYNRRAQYDQLVAYTKVLAGNARLLKATPELAATVARIQQQAARKGLEQLEATARADQDPDKHAAVGAGYLELYRANPKLPDGDELLYNAGVAFEQGLAFDAAIEAYALLQRTYPTSKLIPRVTARLGQSYARRAIYDKAAEQLERYATRYAGERDAYQALSDAVFYRKGLGDRDKAIADTNLFVKMFGAKRPREAADAMWSLTALYEAGDPERAITHLRDYLRTFGPKGPPERITIAHAKLGQLLWKQSCPVPGVDGLCARSDERAKVGCGADTTRTFAVVARDPRKARLALEAFATATKEYERRPTTDAAARYFYAQSKLAAADAEAERYLAIVLPRDLALDGGGRAGVKRFGDWLEQKQRAGATATRLYEAVFHAKDVVSTITAAARLGVVSQSFAGALLTGPLPAGARSSPKVDVYCRAMIEAAEPIEARAVEAFAVCLAKSTELGWFGESSRYCERELLRLRPAEFPAALELRARPSMVGPVIDLEPPL